MKEREREREEIKGEWDKMRREVEKRGEDGNLEPSRKLMQVRYRNED